MLADYALIDQHGKLSVLGIFQHVWVESFPAVHPRTHLVLRVTGRRTEIGERRIRIRFEAEDGQELLAGEGTRMTGTVLEEGLRGSGGHLIDSSSKRFMLEYDPRGERATRDIVSRSIMDRVRKGFASPHGGVWIAMSHLGPDRVRREFKGMVERCADCGFDLAAGRVEVIPTAHYMMGGIVFADIEDGEVRAAAELKKLGDTWGRDAEAAFSVEAAYQEQKLAADAAAYDIEARSKATAANVLNRRSTPTLLSQFARPPPTLLAVFASPPPPPPPMVVIVPFTHCRSAGMLRFAAIQ